MKNFFTILSIIILFVGCKDSGNKNQSLEAYNIEESLNGTGEQFRPKFHFTPEKNWMNDPNGMVFYKGNYHLFYQYYPKDNVWGPMHWGHAVSKDLVHWERLPIALFPDELGYIFSGSAVVDWENTSGFGTKENPPLVAIYTYHDPDGEKQETDTFQTQGIAYSLDSGKTWIKYGDNPVLKNPGIRDFRDPKVIWHKQIKKWIMSLAVKNQVYFYSSENLKDWNLESQFGKDIGAHGGVWECPDLFPLKDKNGNEKWILIVSINPGAPQGGSGSQYFIGSFDGKEFTPDDNKIRWLDYGADNYAGVTYSDIPEQDGRRIFIGWMSNWDYAQVVPTYSWRSAMTIPRELILRNNSDEYYIQSKPIFELQKLIKAPKTINGNSYLSESSSYFIELKEIDSQDLVVEFKNDLNESFKIQLKNGTLSTDRSEAGNSSFKPSFAALHEASINLDQLKNLKIFVDNSSFEIFANDGELVMTELVFPTKPLITIEINGQIDTFIFSPIESIWSN